MRAIAASAALGALAGGRTFAVPAVLSRKLGELWDPGEIGPVTDALAAPGVGRALAALAAAEVVADKLPFMGPRTDPRGLVGRLAAGAIAGAATAEMLGRRPLLPAAVGAAAAWAGAHLGYRLRRAIRRKADLPDPIVAVAEDVAVYGGASSVVDDLLDAMTDLLADRRYG